MSGFRNTCVLSTIALILVGLPACLAENAQEEPASAGSCSALTANQGVQLQGLRLQGMELNGFWENGFWENGFWENGFWENGFWENGFWDNGFWDNGLALRGLTEEEAASLIASGQPVPRSNVVSMTFRDGTLEAHTPTGEILRGNDLVGVLLPFADGNGRVVWVGIAEARPDETQRDLELYTLEAGGQNPCGEGVSGLFVPGSWDETGARVSHETSGDGIVRATYSCTTGALAKCVRFGYRPWVTGADLHQACTRMVRADYCGDGVPHTENGTLIDVFDASNIQTTVNAEFLSFEAGWGPDGAVCVRAPRYVDRTPAGRAVLPSCWADKPACETWSEAQAQGAMLGNDSAHQLRTLSCEP